MPQVVRPVLLLVEDHADTRQMYAEFLGPSFDVLQAANGEEALRTIRERVPALVITDISLPGMDGFELVRTIRGNPSTSTVPVICLSGYSGRSYEQKALSAGCDRLLEKPCMPDALFSAAQDLVARGREAR
jgi:CheY-like chemotaxis protein